MSGLNSGFLGTFLIILALILVGTVFFVSRSLRGVRQASSRLVELPFSDSMVTMREDAVILVQIGGSVWHMNDLAREWFGYKGNEPNLERLARRTKPSEVFLGLCVTPGQARFSLGGRLVEGSSYYIPSPSGTAGSMVVALRRLQLAEKRGSESNIAPEILIDLSQTMNSAVEFEQTIIAILDSIGRLIPSDFSQLIVLEKDNDNRTPYRLVSSPDSHNRLERLDQDISNQGYVDYLIYTKKPLLIPDIDAYQKIHPELNRIPPPINSYLGTPLLMGDELLGTLELASIAHDAFREDDLDLLSLLSGQAAIALQHTLLYQEMQKRVEELAGLAKLTQASGAHRNSQEFYAHLIDGISPLLQVESIGFLVYDEARRRLVAQQPFLGIPGEFIPHYQVTLPPGSDAEEIWLRQQTIIAYPAVEDKQITALGLTAFIQAAGLDHVVLLPLISGGRMLGYLQVADKKDGSSFDQDDLRKLTIISGQAATLIENLILVRQSQERALRSEALRRIASLTGSVATLDEILSFSLRELARLLRVDMAAILLADESLAELRVHSASLFGIAPGVAARLGRVSMNAPEYQGTVTGSQRSLFCDDVTNEALLAPTYRLMGDVLGLRALINVPIIVRERGVGEVMLGSRRVEFFDPSDLILLTTTASQIAAAIEKSNLYTQTDQSLQRRVDQLTALTRISRELNTSLDLHSLLNLVHDELLRTTKASCGTISLYDQVEDSRGERRAFVRVGDDSEGILSALETKVMAFEEPIVVSDYALPVPSIGNVHVEPPHSGVVSSLIVPIAYQEGIAGLIHLHASVADHFDTTAIEITQSLATQAAIALGNASRFAEQRQRTALLSRRVETIEKVMEAARSLSSGQPLELSLETIAFGIQESTPFNIVIISVYKSETSEVIRMAGVGLPLNTLEEYRSEALPWSSVIELLREEYRINQIHFIPQDGFPYTLYETSLSTTLPVDGVRQIGGRKWLDGDKLLVVLNDPDGNPLGLIQVDQPRDSMRPDKPTLESLEIFASQASLVIESHQRLDDLYTQIGNVQAELTSARSALDAKWTAQPIFQQNDTAIETSHGSPKQRSQRIQIALNIAELVNQQVNRLDVLRVFAQEVIAWMNFSQVLIAETHAGNPHLLDVLGTLPSLTTNLDILLGQRNPLKTTLQNGELLQVGNVNEDVDWKGTPLLSAIDAKAFICLPIIVGESVDAAALLVSKNPLQPLPKEDVHLFELISRQVAIALENLRLLEETNRRLKELNLLLEFSRQLGSLDLLSILQGLVESALKAVPHARAGMVALWQADIECLVPKIAIGYSHNDRMLEIIYHPGQALPGNVYESGEAVRVDEVIFSKHYNLPPEYLMVYRDATEGQLPVSSLIVPVQTNEIKLGVLVLDNFQDTGVFTHDDQKLISSLTHQTALTLENTRLYQATQQRAAQLLALTDVAATITSSLKSNELIESLLGQVRSIIPYDTGTLWLRQGNKLTVSAAAGFEDSDYRLGLSVALEDSLLLKEMIETSQPILVGDVRDDARFPTLLETPYLTWLGVPLISKGQVVGVIALEKVEDNFYSTEHIDAVVIFAGQAAVALENARLYEESIRRAAELDERSQRLTLLNRLSKELSGSLDLGYILGLTLRELSQAVRNDLLSAILFDASARPFLHAELPWVIDNYPVAFPESAIFERLHETLGIFSTDDVTGEEELEHLQDFLASRATRSLLILPLVTGSDLHGLLLAHVHETYRFDFDEVELARTISNQAAVAIQNARLFQETERLFSETQKRSAELGMLFELGVNITQVLDQTRLVDATFENVTRLLAADTCGLVMAETEDTLELRALDKGERVGPIYIARSGTSFSEYVLKTGEPLFIRDMDREKENLPVQGYTLGQEVKSWLGVPLMVRGLTMGVLSVQSYRANAFGDTQLRLLGQVGNQLAVALDNARLFGNTQVYAADLAQRVSERTKELETEHNRSQTLLRIITELSASLDQDMVLNRTLAILNETIGAQYSAILLMHPEKRELFLRSSLADDQLLKRGKASRDKVWMPCENLATWVVTESQSVLIPNVTEDKRWFSNAERPGDFRCIIAVPLLMGEESLGSLILMHQYADQFDQNMLELAQTAAKQIAVSINNTQLFNLIRDQAERLGELLRTQHVETSRSQAILEAVADGVLVTDAHRVITLFNASAEMILGLERKQVVGQSLENFIGLFGKAAHEWVQTIQLWSEDSQSYRPGESKSEQIELDDHRVVSVHLSPVLLRNDFLGTVSIFQDITHLIELDRLKSEFVATVSHELRTPMTSIKGYVEILLMGAAGSLNDSQVHFLQVVRSNTERLAILVNDLLDISRIEAGRVTLSMQPLDIPQIIQSSIDIVTRRSSDEGRPMKFEVKSDPNLPSAYGDRERVQQILDNLVQNAYQYTPEEGKIQIRAQVIGKMMQLDVQDNGIGVPMEDQPRVFERFFRGEDPLVLATSGTGLGLSIVKHLVEMHAGRIWFTSPGIPGMGSVFSFTLPLYDDEKMV